MDAIKTFPKFSIIFLFLMGLEIAGLTVIPTFHMVSKAMIMASLIGFYIMTERRQNYAFLAGLIFALLGDCFLLYETVELFVVGLICFLIMQLCYAAAFNIKRRVPRNRDYLISGIIVMVGLGVLAYLWEDIGSLRTAVALYVLSIIIMAVYAYLRHPKFRGYKFVLGGVILFIISDSILGINKFSGPIPNGQIYVMLTYMLAQYMIVTGEVLSNMPAKEKVSTSAPASSFSRHRRGN